MKLPLCSSALVVKILEADGFRAAKTSGSHRTYRKYLPDQQRHLTTVVVLAKREIARGTLNDILALAEMPHERFRALHARCR